MVSVGTIIWLSSELMFFAALFASYFTIRSVSPVLWAHSCGLTARIVKYDANRAAKNISSLESQMIVPTLTMLGRSWCPWSLEAGIVVEAVATTIIMAGRLEEGHPDPLMMDDIFSGG
jgi:heme/copper-type cytochrome/quinol oxidase subunit 3